VHPKESRGREGREGNGSMHPLGFFKVGAYAFQHWNLECFDAVDWATGSK